MVTKNASVDYVMEALGDQTRRDILAILKANPAAVGDIAAHFSISRPAISKHLRILEQAGLVEHQAHGTRNIFRLRAIGFEAAQAYVASFWDDALASFQRLAEAEQPAES
jgi:DNA-binding transcriptional ArsR family regulator